MNCVHSISSHRSRAGVTMKKRANASDRFSSLLTRRFIWHSLPVRFDILSLFPQIAAGALGESMMKRAQERGLVEIHSHNLRDWARDKHHVTDEPPYGGGPGMVMKCQPIFDAVEALRRDGSGN